MLHIFVHFSDYSETVKEETTIAEITDQIRRLSADDAAEFKTSFDDDDKAKSTLLNFSYDFDCAEKKESSSFFSSTNDEDTTFVTEDKEESFLAVVVTTDFVTRESYVLNETKIEEEQETSMKSESSSFDHDRTEIVKTSLILDVDKDEIERNGSSSYVDFTNFFELQKLNESLSETFIASKNEDIVVGGGKLTWNSVDGISSNLNNSVYKVSKLIQDQSIGCIISSSKSFFFSTSVREPAQPKDSRELQIFRLG